ncbi:hypothetical protein FBU30_007152, partial [Linnemannia zychae]
ATATVSALDKLALSLNQVSFGAHSNTTPLSAMTMAHALLVHSSRHSCSSSSSAQQPSSFAASASVAATTTSFSTSTNMSDCSRDVPAKHYFHNAVPTSVFDVCKKSSAGDGRDDCTTDPGRLQQVESMEDIVAASKQTDCLIRKATIAEHSTTSSSRAQWNRAIDLEVFTRQSVDVSFISSDESENDDVKEKEVARCVTPTYLDYLMNDSDTSGMSGSDDSSADDEYYDFDLDPAALVASMDPESPYYHLSRDTTTAEILKGLVEFGRTPKMFDHTPSASMSFFISPFAISQLAKGLWTRSEPACVIIHTRLPQRTGRFDDYPWSDDALRMLNLPNAGGSSLLSEVLSCEMLFRCLDARLAKTEMEIRYIFAYQPMTDYTISLPGLASDYHVGVSVTRAFAYKGAYRRSECRKLLKKKLSGIIASTRNVMDERLFKQILHVWVPNGKVARTVQATYRTLPVELTRNSVVIISVVNAAWVFNNRR